MCNACTGNRACTNCTILVFSQYICCYKIIGKSLEGCCWHAVVDGRVCLGSSGEFDYAAGICGEHCLIVECRSNFSRVPVSAIVLGAYECVFVGDCACFDLYILFFVVEASDVSGNYVVVGADCQWGSFQTNRAGSQCVIGICCDIAGDSVAYDIGSYILIKVDGRTYVSCLVSSEGVVHAIECDISFVSSNPYGALCIGKVIYK